MKRDVCMLCVYIYMTQSLCRTINNIVIQPYLNKILLKVNQEMLIQAS